MKWFGCVVIWLQIAWTAPAFLGQREWSGPQHAITPNRRLDSALTEFGDAVDQAASDDQWLGSIQCGTCKNLARALKRLARVPYITTELVVEVGQQICVVFGLQSRSVCLQVIPKFGPWFMDILRSDRFQPSRFCSAVNVCLNEAPHFTPTFPKPKPEPHAWPGDVSARPSRKIVHLSDWHYDPEYREGLEADCGEPICCRNPVQGGVRRPAGLFGDYDCDTPRRLAQEVLTNVREVAADADIVFLTGDLPPHDVWLATRESVEHAEGIVSLDANQAFPATGNQALFYSIGNHESPLANSFPTTQTDPSISQLYSRLSNEWSAWLPDSAQTTFSQHGFYSVVRTEDRLKIISLNTNFAYLMNWWIFIAEPDPEQIFEWLITELQDAEDRGLDVYILGHIPPGRPDVSQEWSSIFYQIVQRYENVIAAQFYGHSHRDEIQLFYSDDLRIRPVGVAYIAPSITTFSKLNPGFRVYDVDRSSNRVINHHTYVLNLTASNVKREPVWVHEYDAKTAYDMSDLSPDSWHALVKRMDGELRVYGDSELIRKYIQFKSKSAPFNENCDLNCLKGVLCAIQTAKLSRPCETWSGLGVDQDGFEGWSIIEPYVDVALC